MIGLLNLLKKLTCLLSACLLLCTGGINAVFNGDAAPFSSVEGVVLTGALLRSQGVTTDGARWIFSGKSALESVDIRTGEIVALYLQAIPEELKTDFGTAHIGGISCANGIVYAAVEDSKVWKHPLVALYNAGTLAFTGTYYELPTENHTRGVPWVIADPENGVLYAGDSRNSETIYRYTLTELTPLEPLVIDREMDAIQGGEYYEGRLILGTNDRTRAVYAVSVADGHVEKLFDRITYEYRWIDNFGGEGEDLTVLPLPDGTLIHTLQIGATFTDATLRHYKQEFIAGR